MINTLLIIIILFFSFSTAQNKADTTLYEEGGIKFIRHYDPEGREDGVRVSFYKSGKQCLKMNFIKNEPHREAITLWENGKSKSVSNYNMGKLIGWSTNWDSLGFPTDSILYEKDKKKERFLFYKDSRQVRVHQYYIWKENKKMVAMEDVYSKDGKIISQVRNGNGISHKMERNGDYSGIEVYKNGDSDFRDYISKDSGDPRLKRKQIPKNKLLPWIIEKYGKI